MILVTRLGQVAPGPIRKYTLTPLSRPNGKAKLRGRFGATVVVRRGALVSFSDHWAGRTCRKAQVQITRVAPVNMGRRGSDLRIRGALSEPRADW